MSHYAQSAKQRSRWNAKAAADMSERERQRKAYAAKTSWPTIPCCDAMRGGLACDCCEVVDS